MLDPTEEQAYREALFSLLESCRVSRSALYLMEPTGEFRLAAHLGFSPRDLPVASFGKDSALFERINHYRKPFYFNSPSEAGELGRLMESSHTARLLAGPMYEDGRLIGIIEARDKAAGELFHHEDAGTLSAVISAILARRRAHRGPGDSAEELSSLPGLYEMPAAPAAGSLPPASASELTRPELAKILPARKRPPLTQREAALFRSFGSALLMNAGLGASAFSLWKEDSAEFFIASREPLSEGSRSAVVASAQEVFANLYPGRPRPSNSKFSTDFPLGAREGVLETAQIAGIQSSVVVSEEGRATLFTLVFLSEPDPTLAAAVKETHLLVRRAVSEAREAVRYREAFRGLVRRLLEPGLKKHTALVTHSLAVGKLARGFATFLKLPETTVEQMTVAALLHDVGLRELAYDRLSQRRPLAEAEYRLARDHPSVGAMLLSEIDFPFPVVPLVLHHHERYDGSGYPDQLRGEQIPFGSRLIHIVEAFDAMTSLSSYRPPIGRDEAVDRIVSKAGTQFDPDLAVRFGEFVSSAGIDRA
ncbi:MAG: HD-GYP domain-containing protein [Thermoanaerobaculia bacterium]